MTALIAAAVVVAGLYFGREVLVPFALAVLLSFLLVPLLRRLYRLGIGRIPAVAFTVLLGILAIAGFVAVVVTQLSPLVDELPNYQRNLEAKISSLPRLLPGATTVGRISGLLHGLRAELAKSQEAAGAPARGGAQPASPAVPVEIQSPPTPPLETVKSFVGPLLLPLADAGLVLLFVIWILLNRESLRDRLLALGGGDLHRTTQTMNDAAERVSRYLISQLAVNAGCGLTLGIGLAVIGIPYAALWGAAVLVMRFVPYLGIIIAAALPIAISLAVAPGWSLALWTVLLFLAVETVTSNLIEPRLYAATAGLSSLGVVVAAVFWTFLWGPVGLLLSTPLTVCLVVLGRHIPQLGVLGTLFGDEAPLSPEQALYQRLLVGDPEEATEQAAAFLEHHSLGELFDTVVVPSLILAQDDSNRGVLTAERRATVASGIATMLDNLASDIGDEPPRRSAATRRIVCVPARNELDEAAARLLVYLLRAEASEAAATLVETALAEADRQPSALTEARLVCLSMISAPSAAPARYLVRRLQRRAPQAHLLIGLWGEHPAPPILSDASAAPISVSTITSLRDAVAEIAAVIAADRNPPAPPRLRDPAPAEQANR